MTLVVTHTEGFLGCFTVNADGSMRQRALIDTGPTQVTPQALAELGTSLAEQYDWTLTAVQTNGHEKKAVAAADPIKALKALPEKKPQKKQKPPSRQNYVHRSYPSAADKRALILECLRVHPEVSLMEALPLMGQPADGAASSNWNHTFKALLTEGTIVRSGPGNSVEPFRYSLAGA